MRISPTFFFFFFFSYKQVKLTNNNQLLFLFCSRRNGRIMMVIRETRTGLPLGILTHSPISMMMMNKPPVKDLSPLSGCTVS